jgi:eukaryotic-like serine/threonine-protein kinase
VGHERARWVDAEKCDARWKRVRSLGGGGQADSFLATRLGEGARVSCFLKVLRDQSSRERRGRMFREASALDTYDHPRIPQLIESNAHRHGDAAYRLYLVTEFVPGQPLSDRYGKPFPFMEAVVLTDQLADAVSNLWRHEAVHRDIKPENVMLRDGAVDAVLVDFGLIFKNPQPGEFATDDGQEVGNRFLRASTTIGPMSPS